MPNYSYVSFAQALAALQARLYGSQFWGTAELTAYLVESLRTWNAYTSYWRDSFPSALTANQTWYDLSTIPGTLRPYTVTQYDLISTIEYHLLEPPTPNAWSGSLQYSLNDLLFALQRRQDEVLGTTGCTQAQALVNAPQSVRVTLADNVIDIRRVAWIPGALPYTPKILRQSDRYAARAFNPGYLTTGLTPSNWIQSDEPPPSFDVYSTPPVSGQYDVVSVNSGPAWTAGTNAGLNVPDDWSWVIKWGAMYDLFGREGNAKDPTRAQYCEQRFKEGLALLESASVVLDVQINQNPAQSVFTPLLVDAIRNGDDFNPTWQAQTPGVPTSVYTSANLLAFARTPNMAYPVNITVVQNAPVTGTNVQIGRDDLDTIIDYAQHLAMFKQGGAEFLATVPLYQKFVQRASLYNDKLKAMGIFQKVMYDTAVYEESRNPRYAVGAGPQG